MGKGISKYIHLSLAVKPTGSGIAIVSAEVMVAELILLILI